MFKSIVMLATLAVALVSGKQSHETKLQPAKLMQTNSNWNVAGTMKIVKEFEGLRLTAYQDSVGVWTIGYGHTGTEVK